MKKTLVTALTTALVVGAASTTFAASNPFSDVPMDHWAYDAVAQLASDGVIDGYGDGTFRGERSITRYEMAQLVARAMASEGMSAADRNLVDRLAAEFSDELSNLGVRVANLERNADKVKWTGELRYRYNQSTIEKEGTSDTKYKRNQLQLRLFPTAEVNNNWKVKARLTASNDMKEDKSSNVALTYAYAEGKYGNTVIKLGKQDLVTTSDQLIVADDFFSGASVKFGKDLTVRLEAGRWSNSDAFTDKANYQGVDFGYSKDKLTLGAGFRHFNSKDFESRASYSKDTKEDTANIWSLGGRYRFDKNLALHGAYAQNAEADAYEKAGIVGLEYKGAKTADRGSWGATLHYRHYGNNVAFAPTQSTTWKLGSHKGWEIGAKYVPFVNTRLELNYLDGKKLDTKEDVNSFYARFSLFF